MESNKLLHSGIYGESLKCIPRLRECNNLHYVAFSFILENLANEGIVDIVSPFLLIKISKVDIIVHNSKNGSNTFNTTVLSSLGIGHPKAKVQGNFK